MPRARGEFSVCVFYPNDSHRYVMRYVSAESAMNCAHIWITGGAARRGEIERVIVTDGGDHTNFEWKYGQGITYPERNDAA